MRLCKLWGCDCLTPLEIAERILKVGDEWAAERQRLEKENRRLRFRVALRRFEAEKWRREADALFERLRPLIGNAVPRSEHESTEERELQEARSKIGQAIAQMTPPGDSRTERHLWEYAERELQIHGPGARQDIFERILAGESDETLGIDVEAD